MLDRELETDELRELESFLCSPGLVETSMDIYGIDGYLTAILSGPRTFLPSEWMPSIWDCEGRAREPEFENLAHAQRIVELLMRHYNSVARALMDADGPFVPIYPEGDTEAAATWCAGYLTGVALDAPGWDDLVLAEPQCFAPIFGLGTAHEGDTEPEPAQAALWCRQVGPSAAKIHALWLGKRPVRKPGIVLDDSRVGFGPRLPGRSLRARRNDPCPCGSGKKYKRCCGARMPS